MHTVIAQQIIFPDVRGGLPFVAAFASLLLGLTVLIQQRRSFASWSFLGGMLLFSIENILSGISLRTNTVDRFIFWQELAVIPRVMGPPVWLAFSLSYSRGNFREFLARWRFILLLAAVVPLSIVGCFFTDLIVLPDSLFPSGWESVALSVPGKCLNAISLVTVLLVLANFERTLKAAVGTMRWRVKFLLLGLGLILGAQIYSRSQALLFSSQDLRLLDMEAGALLIGCVMIAVAHVRRGFSEVDVYPSQAVLQNSISLALAGAYLFLVGILAQVAKWMGGVFDFQLQALVVLAGVAGLGILLFSERLRHRVKYFVSRHFRRSQHDFRRVWRSLTEHLVSANGAGEACLAATKVISESFNALSVTIWLIDDQGNWKLGASSREVDTEAAPARTLEPDDLNHLSSRVEPFDLESVNASWAEDLRQAARLQFSPHPRLAAVIRAGREAVGIAILGDRVYRMPYTAEEFELLKCLVDQLASTLLNFRLGGDLARARELETFQTVSAFFVHDLKNSASSLNLLLENLPRHFDNPEFREDALRGLARTAGRIDALIARLSTFRGQLELNFRSANLTEMIADAIEQMGPRAHPLQQDLQVHQAVRIDSEQMKGVVTNLLANAYDATPPAGAVSIRTEIQNDHAVLTVSDSGAGMTSEFLRHSLFRPFQTTKKKGIGIGMFQARMIVEAHRGRIQVNSEPGRGTTFRVFLPLS